MLQFFLKLNIELSTETLLWVWFVLESQLCSLTKPMSLSTFCLYCQGLFVSVTWPEVIYLHWALKCAIYCDIFCSKVFSLAWTFKTLWYSLLLHHFHHVKLNSSFINKLNKLISCSMERFLVTSHCWKKRSFDIAYIEK